MNRAFVLLGAPSLIALFAAVAAAQSPIVSGYGGQAGVAEVQVRAGEAEVVSVLPFTGLELSLVVVAALGLLVIGVALRRVARQKG